MHHLVRLSSHPDASSPDFGTWLDEYSMVPFRPVTLSLSVLPIPDFTEYPVSRPEWAIVRRLSKRYGTGQPVHPILVYHAQSGWRVLDGCHRILAARRAGLSAIEAWEAQGEPVR